MANIIVIQGQILETKMLGGGSYDDWSLVPRLQRYKDHQLNLEK